MSRGIAILLALAVAGCSSAPEEGVVAVSVIGGQPQIADPNRVPLDAPARVMAGAVMQGLVAFDAAGQVEPALAERWIITDDGLSYFFRISRTRWTSGQKVTAFDVARSLKASLAASSRNPLRPLMSNVQDVIALTEHVVEIRLFRPQVNLLPLLAQPEFAVMRSGQGTGPYRVFKRTANTLILRPALPDKASEDAMSEEERRASERRVRGEKASLAISRYAAGHVSLVLGGDFDSLPLPRAARIAESAMHVDPVSGLFGFVMRRGNDALSDKEVRQALAMAIDRNALLALFDDRRWKGALAVLPAQIDSAATPAQPGWANLGAEERLSRARAAISDWRKRNDADLVLRVQMPTGPGGRLMFAQLASDWKSIGVRVLRPGPKEAADLKLVDLVVPNGSALWYFNQLNCARGIQCSPEADLAMREAQQAIDSSSRSVALAKADAALADAQAFIPIASPLRWSLAAPKLAGFRENPYAIHRLNRLRGVVR